MPFRGLKPTAFIPWSLRDRMRLIATSEPPPIPLVFPTGAASSPPNRHSEDLRMHFDFESASKSFVDCGLRQTNREDLPPSIRHHRGRAGSASFGINPDRDFRCMRWFGTQARLYSRCRCFQIASAAAAITLLRASALPPAASTLNSRSPSRKANTSRTPSDALAARSPWNSALA
jgi:hypothetical protein